MSGVSVNERCISEFSEFKLRSRYSYIIFRLSADLKEIIVEKTADESKGFDDLLRELPADEPRYAVTHFKYSMGADGERSKIVFIGWCPTAAHIKLKMIYAASKSGFKRTMQGINIDVQAGCAADLDRAIVLEHCQRFNRN